MMSNENNYPLSYEEFEEQVLELLFEDYGDEFIETLKKRLDILKNKNPDYMLGLYNLTCFIYDSPHIYGDSCKNAFEKDLLRSAPVHELREMIGLGMIPWDDLQ